MNKKMVRSYISIAIIVLISALIVGFFVAEKDESISLFNSDYESLSDGWYVIEDSRSVDIDQLPTRLETDDGKVTIHIELDSRFEKERTLLFRASLQDITVRLDGVIIYEHLKSNYSDHVPYASLWHIVNLDEGVDGQTLSVTLYTPYERFDGMVNDVIIGDQSTVIVSILDHYGYRFIIGVIILLSGLVILFANQFVDREFSRGRIYLSSFVIMFSLWIIGESRVLQLVLPNQALIGSISYLMVAAMPIPITLYVKNYVAKNFDMFYQLSLYAFIVIFFSVIAGQYFGFIDYFESALWVQLFLLTIAITTVVLMFIEYYKYHSQEARIFLNHFLVIVLFAVTEISNFLMSEFAHTSIYGLVIITFYLVYMLFYYIVQIRRRYRLSYQLEMLSELVYVDALTGGKNRHAFERDVEKSFNEINIRENLRIVMFDLDDLKEINDTQGHYQGDEALKLALQIIDNIFGEYGGCYRIGGDEFACIMEVADDEIYEQCVQDFALTLNNIPQEYPFKLNVSVGSQAYIPTMEKPSDMLRLADQKMYIDKYGKKVNNGKTN